MMVKHFIHQKYSTKVSVIFFDGNHSRYPTHAIIIIVKQ